MNMRNKILIVNQCLYMAGAEKLLFEICMFAQKNDLKPVIVIPNILEKEYYDDILQQNGIKVIRIILGIKQALKNLLKYPTFKNLRCLYWNIIFRFFLQYYFQSVQLINLGSIAKEYYYKFSHKNRYFWHVGNNVQYENQKYPFGENIFQNPNDTLIYINKYQIDEIREQYKNIKCEEILFKLFINE